MTTVESYSSPGWEATVREIVQAHLDQEGAVLPVLHEVQDRFGYISEPALDLIAEGLHLTSPQVYAVASFYNEFRLGHQPEHRVTLCRGPACRANGGKEIRRRFEEALGVEIGETTADGRVALDTCGCMGICPHGPSIQVDHEVIGRVTPEEVAAIVAGRDPRASLNGAHSNGKAAGKLDPEVRR